LEAFWVRQWADSNAEELFLPAWHRVVAQHYCVWLSSTESLVLLAPWLDTLSEVGRACQSLLWSLRSVSPLQQA